ncbi:MAG: hypothetical protein MJ252_27885 [archaeon]|nr:hypothetical protein [archaeon]
MESDSQDSFNLDITKVYNNKKTEINNRNRPVSSYHPNIRTQKDKEVLESEPTEEKKETKEKTKEKPKPKCQSANPIVRSTHAIVNNEPPKKSVKELLTELNDFIQKNKITKDQFIENEDIFYSFEDFKQALISIHYNIHSSYVKAIFNETNINDEENFFLNMGKFVKKLNFYKDEYDKSKFKTSENNSSLHESRSKEMTEEEMKSKLMSEQSYKNQRGASNYPSGDLTELSKERETTNKYSTKKDNAPLNNEFAQFNSDIRDILTGKVPEKNKRMSSRKSSKISLDAGKNKNKTYYKEDNNHQEFFDDLAESNSESSLSETLRKLGEKTQKLQKEGLKPIKRYNAKEAVQESMKREEMEEKKRRELFKRDEKEYEMNCYIKKKECNKMSKMLKDKKALPKRVEYTFDLYKEYDLKYPEYKLGEIPRKKKVEVKEEKEEKEEEKPEVVNLELKAVRVQWSMLNKQLKRQEMQEKREQEKLALEEKKLGKSEIEKKLEEQNKRRSEIEMVLKESVQLKIELKKQLESLKSKIKIQRNDVINALMDAGMDLSFVKEGMVPTTDEKQIKRNNKKELDDYN